MAVPEYNTQGGFRTFCCFSGSAALNDQLVCSGAGRVNALLPHVLLSGVAIILYDSSVATSGGPFAASGHKIVGTVPVNATTATIITNISFQSGLCAATKSGQPGFTINWTPETNNT